MAEMTAEEIVKALRNIDADIDNAMLYEEYVFSDSADLIENQSKEIEHWQSMFQQAAEVNKNAILKIHDLESKIKEFEGKNVAKKVTLETGMENEKFFVCPNCGRIVMGLQQFCDKCSQKLDWSVENE